MRWREEQERCPQCHRPRSECSEQHKTWFAQRTTCYVKRAEEWAKAAYEQQHKDRPWHNGIFTEWAEKQSPAHPYHYLHGVSVYVSDVDRDPGDDFANDPTAQPAEIRAAYPRHQPSPESSTDDMSEGGDDGRTS